MFYGMVFNPGWGVGREARNSHVAIETDCLVAVKGEGQSGQVSGEVAGLHGPKQSKAAAVVAETE